MAKKRIVCVVPTIRPESHAKFVAAWGELFRRHDVTLVTVWDGEIPLVQVGGGQKVTAADLGLQPKHSHLFCRFTDACRNLGFVAAAQLDPDVVITADDDVYPIPEQHFPDPIQAHLDTLEKRVPVSWLNTAHQGAEYLRGVPYGVRGENRVMLSHGVWTGTPDFDGETQLRLEASRAGVPYTLPYYVGPIPRGIYAAISGMWVAVNREALPLLYFAPMGVDSGYPNLHRFADIFMGCAIRAAFDVRQWAMYTGASAILHSRASDAAKNFEQEKLGRKWLEEIHCERDVSEENARYWRQYADKREEYRALVWGILEGQRK